MLLGNNYVRPGRIELECAEEFLAIIEGADMVKFAKTAPTRTRRRQAWLGLHRADMVAVCGTSRFLGLTIGSSAARPMSAGIPACTRSP